MATAHKASNQPRAERRVKLFRNGRSRAVRIPKEFELPGDEVFISKVGDTLTIRPVRKMTLLEYLDTLEPIEEEFEIPEPELPLDDIVL